MKEKVIASKLMFCSQIRNNLFVVPPRILQNSDCCCIISSASVSSFDLSRLVDFTIFLQINTNCWKQAD